MFTLPLALGLAGTLMQTPAAAPLFDYGTAKPIDLQVCRLGNDHQEISYMIVVISS